MTLHHAALQQAALQQAAFNHAEVFDAVAGAVPDRAAILYGERRFSYRQLQQRVQHLAVALAGFGIRRPVPRSQLANWESGQDHVALYLHNGNEYMETTLAANRVRAVPFNVNYRYVAHELAYLLNDARPAVIVYHDAFAPALDSVLPELARPPVLVRVADGSGHAPLRGAHDYETLIAVSGSEPPDVALSPDDLYMLYTGGTTGMPKGTLWRQCDIYDAAIAGMARVVGLDTTSLATIASSAPATKELRSLPSAPFMHGAAGWAALGTVTAGGTLVIQNEVTRFDPADVLATIARDRVTSVLIVGDAFGRPLCEQLERTGYDLASLAVVVSGGATLSTGVKGRLLELLPHVTIIDASGSSETGPQMTAASNTRRAAESGVFAPSERTCVVDDAREHVVQPGHPGTGWLATRGAIPLGYLGDEAKTAATFPVIDGQRMSLPGDRARLRADGLIELLGRESATINSGGEKIFAEEVEQAVISHPDVDDAIVAGRPSARWGNEVVAIVQLRAGAAPTDEDLLAAAAQRIARYKLPKSFVRVAHIRRSPAGKADYAWARAVATEPDRTPEPQQ